MSQRPGGRNEITRAATDIEDAETGSLVQSELARAVDIAKQPGRKIRVFGGTETVLGVNRCHFAFQLFDTFHIGRSLDRGIGAVQSPRPVSANNRPSGQLLGFPHDIGSKGHDIPYSW